MGSATHHNVMDQSVIRRLLGQSEHLFLRVHLDTDLGLAQHLPGLDGVRGALDRAFVCAQRRVAALRRDLACNHQIVGQPVTPMC